MNASKYRAVFKRLETDEEYRARVCGKWCTKHMGTALDEHVDWAHASKKDPKQRKIIEDVQP